jgi:hypothetical protein
VEEEAEAVKVAVALCVAEAAPLEAVLLTVAALGSVAQVMLKVALLLLHQTPNKYLMSPTHPLYRSFKSLPATPMDSRHPLVGQILHPPNPRTQPCLHPLPGPAQARLLHGAWTRRSTVQPLPFMLRPPRQPRNLQRLSSRGHRSHGEFFSRRDIVSS